MSLFCLIIIVQLVVSYVVIERIGEINNLKSQINSINSKWYEIRNNSLDYFNQESRNVDYFETGRSEYLWKIKRLYKEVKVELAEVMNNEHIKNMDIHHYAESARITFYKYHTYFHEIEVRTLAKGYFKYGLEGEMSEAMSKLEKSDRFSKNDLLLIRQNEKDFILRGNETYSEKALELANGLIRELKRAPGSANSQDIDNMQTYINAFESYLEHSEVIGVNNKSGLRKVLNKEAAMLEKDLLKLSVKFNKQYENQTEILIGTILFSALIIIILSIVVGLVVSKNISRPIVGLANKLKESMSVDLDNQSEYKLPANASQEIISLDNAFTSLFKQIKSQVSEINGINSELKIQNEELTQLNLELDKFIYHTSHDLRAPLTSVSGLIEVIETSDEKDIQEYLNHMKFSILKLDKTIIEIIHFHKNRSTEFRKEPIDLNEMVDVIFEQNRYNPLAKKIDFRIEIDPGIQFCSDSYRMNIILMNLITNSIKYHDFQKQDQYILVTCKVVGDKWVIEVQDNGLGVADAHKGRIFEMFYRASDQSTGSGLGLYIVAESVKKVCGEINFESKEGQGSIFRITLPITEFPFKDKEVLLTELAEQD